MKRIMFVCHGNICRSPMAEFIMKDLVQKAGISDCFLVASSATSGEEIIMGEGNPMYPPAVAELKRHCVPVSERRSVRLERSDYEKYDLFVGMDRNNIRNMHAILGGDPEGKIHKLLEYCSSPADVIDPWYTDRFDIAYKDISRGCRALLAALCSE